MAAVATTQTVKVTINDVEIDVPKGELVVEAVKRVGLEIPVFCYHPRMKPVGMCRMCLVEVGFKQPDGSVRKMPKPQAGCTLPVSEGMVVYTDTEAVQRDRKGVLEFLLVNHPLDCPICDRGGECPLQNNTLAYGPSTSRFIEMKRHLPKAFPLSKYVTLDLERCIQCGRCVRFTEEISGDAQLAFRFRGASMQPSTFQLTDFESKFSGNVIEICPVGALTNAEYRFRARPWDIVARPGICTLTPDGTNIWIDVRSGKLVRVNGRTNEAVNEEWTCDITKFHHDDIYNSPDRLKAVNVREGAGFRGTTWPEAFGLLKQHFAGKGDAAAILVKPTESNEGLYLLGEVAKEVVGTSLIEHRLDAFPRPAGPVEATFEDIEHAPAILVFGASLADEQPMTYLRVRKAWFKHKARVFAATTQATELDGIADSVLRFQPGHELAAAQAIASALGIQTALGLEGACQAAGLDIEAVKATAEALKQTGAVVVSTHALHATQQGADTVDVLTQLAHAAGAAHSHLAPLANSEGAAAVLPAGPGMREILEKAAKGEVKALWLVGFDPVADFADTQLAQKALEAVEFLVVQAAAPNESTPYASLVLPMSLPAENIGTYTSSERRVQMMQNAVEAPGEARPLWKVCAELLARAAERPQAYFQAPDVLDKIRQEIPDFASVEMADLAREGALLDRKRPAVVGGG